MKPLLFFLLLTLLPFSSSGQIDPDAVRDMVCLTDYCFTPGAPWSCVDPNNPTNGEYCLIWDRTKAKNGTCTVWQELWLWMRCPNQASAAKPQNPEVKKVMDEIMSISKSELPELKKREDIQKVIQQFEKNDPKNATLLRVEVSKFTRYPQSYPDPTPITEDKLLEFLKLQREAYSLFDAKYQEAPKIDKVKKKNEKNAKNE